MSNNTVKKRNIKSTKDHLTSYNIVDVCKQKNIGDEDLQNYNEVDLPG